MNERSRDVQALCKESFGREMSWLSCSFLCGGFLWQCPSPWATSWCCIEGPHESSWSGSPPDWFWWNSSVFMLSPIWSSFLFFFTIFPISFISRRHQLWSMKGRNKWRTLDTWVILNSNTNLSAAFVICNTITTIHLPISPHKRKAPSSINTSKYSTTVNHSKTRCFGELWPHLDNNLSYHAKCHRLKVSEVAMKKTRVRRELPKHQIYREVLYDNACKIDSTLEAVSGLCRTNSRYFVERRFAWFAPKASNSCDVWRRCERKRPSAILVSILIIVMHVTKKRRALGTRM